MRGNFAAYHLKAYEEQIIELSGDDEYDVYLQRLPEVLAETFELARTSLNKEENKSKKEDILKLIEITTFELSINNKKELKVKLFGVLETLI